MPGMKSLTPEEAAKQNGVCEVKIDGTRMSFDGQDIKSDRDIIRNDRFPHVVKALRKLNWKVRGEIALPHGNVLQINKRDNWANARFYLFDLFEHNGVDLHHADPNEIRNRIEAINKHLGGGTIVIPRQFDDFGDGWDYVQRQRKKGNYVEGVVLKPHLGSPFKIKYLVEEKLRVIGHEAGSLKGAFLLDRKGVTGKVSANSVDMVKKYKAMIAKGLDPYVEIEYQFLTDDGKPFQPRLRQLDTLANLKVAS
jgi:hypothetical protein